MSGCYARSESKRDPGTSPFEVSALGRDEAEKVTEARRIVQAMPGCYASVTARGLGMSALEPAALDGDVRTRIICAPAAAALSAEESIVAPNLKYEVVKEQVRASLMEAGLPHVMASSLSNFPESRRSRSQSQREKSPLIRNTTKSPSSGYLRRRLKPKLPRSCFPAPREKCDKISKTCTMESKASRSAAALSAEESIVPPNSTYEFVKEQVRTSFMESGLSALIQSLVADIPPSEGQREKSALPRNTTKSPSRGSLRRSLEPQLARSCSPAPHGTMEESTMESKSPRSPTVSVSSSVHDVNNRSRSRSRSTFVADWSPQEEQSQEGFSVKRQVL